MNGEKITISAVRPAARRQPSKVAVFVDFLTELLAEEGDQSIPHED
jgi:hypothetical protein